jgi:hypothetical protein
VGEQVKTVWAYNPTGTDSGLLYTRITGDPEPINRLDTALIELLAAELGAALPAAGH